MVFKLSPRLLKPRVNFARAGDDTALAVLVEGRVATATAHRPCSSGYATRHTCPTGYTPGSGLTVDPEGGALVVRGDDAQLHVAAAPQRSGPIALIDDPGIQLTLTGENPGLGGAHLRAHAPRPQHAQPMTGRWTRFRHAFGPRGQKVLEAFGEGATIEELAIAHSVELSELQR